MRHHTPWNLLGIISLTIVCFGCQNKKTTWEAASSAHLLPAKVVTTNKTSKPLFNVTHWRKWVAASPDLETKIKRLSHVSRMSAEAAVIVGESLRDKEVKIRRWSVWLLGTMAEKHPAAIPWLIQGTRSLEPRIKEWSIGYLQDLPHPKIFASLHQFLKHSDSDVRIWSARSIRKIAPRVQSRIRRIIPDLVRMSSHPSWKEKVAAASLLHRIGTFPLRVDDRKQVGATLILLLHANDWRVRRSAIRALALLGARSVEAVPALLVNARHDTFWYARQEAAEAVLQIRAAISLRAAR